MATLDLSKYGIKDVKEILHNPSYEVLFEEETKAGLEGYEKGQVTELGAVNVMTGIYTGRSPKDKFFVMNEASKDTLWWTSDEYKNDNKPCSEAAWADLTLGWQFSVFAVATIVGSLIVQRFRSANSSESDALQQPDVGQTVTVKKWNDDGTAQVSYRGALWTAYTEQQSERSVGVWRIVRVEGTRLLIEPASH